MLNGDPLTGFRSDQGNMADGRLIPQDDPISQLLEDIHLEKSIYEMIGIPPEEALECGSGSELVGLFVLEGEIEAIVAGGNAEILKAADFMLVTPRQSFTLRNIGRRPPLIGRITYCFDAPRSWLLFKLLPPTVVIRKLDHDSEWEWQMRLSQLIIDRRSTCSVTNAAIDRRLVEVALIGVIQQYLTRNQHLVARMPDPSLARIGPSIRAVHECPERPWTVASLAALAGMSRTLFAVKFAEGTGETPARYLTQLRLERARDLLCRSKLPIAAIAHRAGYGTDVAFARAFRRWYGVSPGRFRADHHRHPGQRPAAAAPDAQPGVIGARIAGDDRGEREAARVDRGAGDVLLVG